MHAPDNWIFWLGFLVFLALMLALDLGLLNRQAHVPRLRESLGWTALWVALAAGFAVLLYFFGQRMTGDVAVSNARLTLEFVTGYVIEESLSLDNLFLFLLIFRYFQIPAALQHKVLFWGILGAIVMRAAFIAAGITLLHSFHFVSYLFGAILLYAGVRLLLPKKEEEEVSESLITRLARRFLRVSDEFNGAHFTVRKNGVRYFTTMALALIVVETTDVVFAVDSIPAVLAVTQHPFIVFTSNIFAILGLRALYFALAGMMQMFHGLHVGLAIVLLLIGGKMLAARFIEIPTLWALAAIVLVLGSSLTIGSLWHRWRQKKASALSS